MDQTMSNLYRAIIGSGTSSGVYNNVVPHSQISAEWINEGAVMIFAKTPGVEGNSLSIVCSGISGLSVGDTRSRKSTYLIGGQDIDPDLIYTSTSTFVVNWSGTNNGGEFEIKNMPYGKEGIWHQFQVSFYNEEGEQALYNGTPYYYSSVVMFDGIDNTSEEISEYAAVLNLMCINSDKIYGSDDFNSPGVLPLSGIARLTWADMSQFYSGLTDHPIAASGTINISPRQLRNVREYSVFMYVPTNNSSPTPSPLYPTTTTALGEWVLCGRTSATYFDIAPPLDKIVSFWVGFGTRKTLPHTTLDMAYKKSTYSAENERE